jgi:outer membrane protein TolC
MHFMPRPLFLTSLLLAACGAAGGGLSPRTEALLRGLSPPPPPPSAGDYMPACSAGEGPVTLASLVAMALSASPEIRAAGEAVVAAEAAARQAGTPANPAVEIGAQGFGGQRSWSEPEESSVVVSQALALGERRSAAQAAMLGEAGVAAWELEWVRREVAARIGRSFVRAQAAQEREALAAAEEKLAQGLLEVVQARVEAGAAGKVGIAETLEVNRTLVSLRKERVDALEQGNLASIELSQLVGGEGPLAGGNEP